MSTAARLVQSARDTACTQASNATCDPFPGPIRGNIRGSTSRKARRATSSATVATGPEAHQRLRDGDPLDDPEFPLVWAANG